MLVVHLHFTDRQSHGKCLARLASAFENPGLIEQFLVSRGQVRFDVAIVLLLHGSLHQQLNLLPYQFLWRERKNRCCSSIALNDPTLRISHHNGFRHRSKNTVELALAQAQMSFDLLALVDFLAQLTNGQLPLRRQLPGVEQSSANAAHGQPDHQESAKQQSQQHDEGAIEHPGAGNLPLRHRQNHLQRPPHITVFPVRAW
jgi:hypothetical protein